MGYKDDEVFFTVIYGDAFIKYVEVLVNSLMLFSTRKIVVFAGDCRIPFEYPNLEVVYFQTRKDIEKSKRTSLKGYPLLAAFHKLEKTLEIFDKGYSKMFFIDADSFVSKYIDNVWDEDVNTIDYPLVSKHLENYHQIWRTEDSEGNVVEPDEGDTIWYDDYNYYHGTQPPPSHIRPYEGALMERLGVAERSSVWYGAAGYYLAGQRARNFFKDCLDCFEMVWDDLKGVTQHYGLPRYTAQAACQQSDEEIMNIMLWKYNASRNLKPTPVWYDLNRINIPKGCAGSLNALKDHFHNPDEFNRRHLNGKYLTEATLEGYVPDDLQDILIFHGNCQGGSEGRTETDKGGPELFKNLFTQYLQEIVMTI